MALTAATLRFSRQKNLNMVDAVVLKSSFNRENRFTKSARKRCAEQIVRHAKTLARAASSIA